MFIKAYEAKFKLIREKICLLTMEDFFGHLATSIENTGLKETLAAGSIRAMTFDLSYAILRHINWITSKMFTEALAEYLQSDYQIARETADAIVARVTMDVAENLDIPAANDAAAANKDYDFLKYIFVASATASDDISLINDLGLGTGLIRCIKQTAQSLMNSSSAPEDGSVNFKPLVEKLLSEIMLEVSEELKVTPWILDIYHLQYYIQNALKNHDVRLSPQIFQVLLQIGREREMVQNKMEELVQKLLVDQPCSIMDASQYLEALHELDLITVSTSSKLPIRKVYSLTPVAQKLTADAYACKFLRVKNPEFGQMLQVNSFYQCAVVRRCPEALRSELLAQCKAGVTRLSPKTVELIIKLFSRTIDHNIIFETMQPILDKIHNMPWFGSSICKSMGALHQAEGVIGLLENILQGDSIPNIKNAANIALSQATARAGSQNAPVTHRERPAAV
jgi:DNA-binding MarR family transcriptional regulator